MTYARASWLTFLACLSSLLLPSCSKKKPAPPPPTCDCTGIVCGKVCDKVCGVCPDDGVCSADGKSCRAALPIGSPCQQNLDCGEGRVCLTTATVNAPGGYCTRPCSASQPCPANSTCQIGTDGNSVCLATCSMTMTCRTSDGYQCDPQGFCPACVAKCSGKTCGDDGCGNQCGQSSPSVPVCNSSNQECTGGQCALAFTPSGTLDDPLGAPGSGSTDGVPNTPPFTYGLWDAAAFDIDGAAIIVGGREAYQYPSGKIGSVSLASIAVFDPTMNRITSVWPPMPVTVARPQAAVLNNVLYVAGGVSNPPTDPPGTLQSNDVAQTAFFKSNGVLNGNAVWKMLAPVPTPFPTGSALVAQGNLLYLIAGDETGVDGGGTPSTRVDVYDPSTDAWNTPNQPPQRTLARTMFAAVSDGLRIWVIGGWDGTNPLATVEIFDPSSGWTQAIDLPQPVVDARAVVANGKIYVFGGRLGPKPFADVGGYIQTIDLTTHHTAVIGRTVNDISGQTPVALRTGQVLLLGGLVLDATNNAVADTSVLRFNIPTP